MGLDASQQNTQTRTLQTWQLALLRFAVTLEASDRQAAREIAAKLDRSSRRDRRAASFVFPEHDGGTLRRRTAVR